tara:strand:+ start:397386 stop:397559 length:174 start_codon:yes stop_codon:yes gene_type:complete
LVSTTTDATAIAQESLLVLLGCDVVAFVVLGLRNTLPPMQVRRFGEHHHGAMSNLLR